MTIAITHNNIPLNLCTFDRSGLRDGQRLSYFRKSIMKKCTKCKKELAFDRFHGNKSKKDGKSTECKDCSLLITRQHRQNNKDRYSKYSHKWRKNNPEQMKKIRGDWVRDNPEKIAVKEKRRRVKYPEKHRANNAVNNAIRDGRLTREPCEICGELKAEGHHESYDKDKQLDVVWLCQKHHNERHFELREMGKE